MSPRCRYTIIYEHTVLVDPTTGRIVQVVDKMQSLGRTPNACVAPQAMRVSTMISAGYLARRESGEGCGVISSSASEGEAPAEAVVLVPVAWKTNFQVQPIGRGSRARPGVAAVLSCCRTRSLDQISLALSVAVPCKSNVSHAINLAQRHADKNRHSRTPRPFAVELISSPHCHRARGHLDPGRA